MPGLTMNWNRFCHVFQSQNVTEADRELRSFLLRPIGRERIARRRFGIPVTGFRWDFADRGDAEEAQQRFHTTT